MDRREDFAPGAARIAETALYVDDLSAARTFYEDVVGLKVLRAGDRAVVFTVGDGQALIVFDESTARLERRTAGGTIPAVVGSADPTPGKSHVAFEVPVGTLDAWRHHLSARGVPVESEVVWREDVESLYFRDPAGHLLEVITPGLWED